jgi:hypothetical protein
MAPAAIAVPAPSAATVGTAILTVRPASRRDRFSLLMTSPWPDTRRHYARNDLEGKCR